MGIRASLEGRPTRTRYVFLAYAASLSLILYLDRVCMSKAAEPIGAELRLDKSDLGWVFSAFTLGYLIFEVPSGSWGDRFGPKRVLVRIVLWWSLFTALTGLVAAFTLDSGLRFVLPGFGVEVPLLLNGFLVLLLIRFLFGAGEAGAYPNLAKCSGRWFPVRERGLAQGAIATAGRLGGAISAGLTAAVTVWANSWVWTQERLGPGGGWRVTFWLFGLLGVVWAAAFAWWFRDDPAEHPSANAAERALIAAGRAGQGTPDPHARAPATPWLALLTSVNLWAYSAMAFCSAFVVYLYFTHFPAYLKERHAVPERWIWVAGLPMVGGAIGCTLGGVLTDWLVRRTGSRRWGRRGMGLAGKGCGATLLLAGAIADDPVLAVALITLSAFASDLALASQWAVCTDAGGRYVGTVFGTMNTVAGVGAALSPIYTGYLLEGLSPTEVGDAAARQRAWDVALLMFAGTLALGALFWLRIDAEESMVGERA
jgi:MFS family permease